MKIRFLLLLLNAFALTSLQVSGMIEEQLEEETVGGKGENQAKGTAYNTKQEEVKELIQASKTTPWKNSGLDLSQPGKRSYYLNYSQDEQTIEAIEDRPTEEPLKTELTQHHVLSGEAELEQVASSGQVAAREELKLKIFSGLKDVNNCIEENRKENPKPIIFEEAALASEDFQQAMDLIEAPMSGADMENRLQQINCLYRAGSCMLERIKELLKQEPGEQAAALFFLAATFYKKGVEEVAVENRTRGRYYKQNASAHEEIAKEVANPSAHHSQAKKYFEKSIDLFNRAVIDPDSESVAAKSLAVAGERYFFLAQEYQKPIINEEAIQSLLLSNRGF